MEPLENIEHQKVSETTVPDLQEKVLAAVKTVYDPEIPVDIYELGLIYEINIYPINNVYIQIKVEVTFDPPYSQDMMSEAAKLELGFL
jgi:metal-sulfur cluster biosynthetic enzyme